ncbi:MAG TPA: hypothetical protein VMU39_29035 [Solirubrobacteraceae bacterium]|nr:hypothetical protein [Solirubrobacteraceae bacterium]
MDLEAYRRRAEAFTHELTGEYYRHYAGLKEDYEIEAIYDDHAELFTRAAVEQLRDALERAQPGSEERRRRAMLLDFAVEGYIGLETKRPEAEIARREAGIVLELGGERLGFRESAVAQANEPDGARRAEIEDARLAATEERLNPLYREVLETQHAIAAELGYASYRELCAQCKGFDLAALRAQTAEFSAHSQARYPAVVEPELRHTLGLALDDARRSDLPRFFRAPELDASFPEETLISSFAATMRGLGIDIGAQAGVVLDVDPRPQKSPRAFCAPVRVPGEVYLVLAPVGGRDDYAVLFHEAGHTEHYAHVDAGLPFEFRHLGDNAITESFAFLFQHLVEDPEWLARRLGIEDGSAIAAYARAYRLVYLRRYAAKLAYELELHGGNRSAGSWDGLARRYSELLGDALQLPWPAATYLADVDPGFYCACYLRAWALETHIRGYLRSEFGPAWFDSGEAGAALRRLWRDGQRRSPEELLSELTGEVLDFRVLIGDLDL